MAEPGQAPGICGALMAEAPPRLVRLLAWSIGVVVVILLLAWGARVLDMRALSTAQFAGALATGMLAQLVYGSIGMAYGVIANSLLLAGGLAPASATATVHLAEMFTTAATGLAHWRLGHVDPRLFRPMVATGIAGGVLGAVLVTRIDGALLRPWMAAYLLVIGIVILVKAFREVTVPAEVSGKIAPFAFLAGFVDSVGGGGWGIVMTSSLLGAGHEPKSTVGSVNAARFFVSLSSGFTFALLIGVQQLESVAGLILGGLLVAPFAARLTRIVPRRPMVVVAGIIVVGLSLATLLKSFGASF